jgi:hypothetical protein
LPKAVVAELAEDPGTEHWSEAWQAHVALSVPVPATMVGHHLPELGDLYVQDVDQLDLAEDDGRVSVLDRVRLRVFAWMAS